MNIGLLTSTNAPLRQRLDAAELTDAKAGPNATADPVDGDVPAVAKLRPTVNVAPSVTFASMRAALDARIQTDVSSGTLAESDATAVRKTLDLVDSRSGGWTRATAPESNRGYSAAASPQQTARAYLATIERGALVDRYA